MVRNFIAGKGCILGDDMGLGKTIQAIAALHVLIGKTGTNRDGMDIMENEGKVADIFRRQRIEQNILL